MNVDDEIALIPTRVAAGVKFLNANEPGWRGQVYVDRLEMVSQCDCVAGQIMGSKWQGFHDFKAKHDLTDHDACDLGLFHPPTMVGGDDTQRYYEALDEAWKDELTHYPETDDEEDQGEN
jgi:hypothetical protein